jgi:hypothetical protein
MVLQLIATDEYYRMDESTTMLCMKRFCKAIRAVFEPTYLKQATREANGN